MDLTTLVDRARWGDEAVCFDYVGFRFLVLPLVPPR